jgi:hypothetical protein
VDHVAKRRLIYGIERHNDRIVDRKHRSNDIVIALSLSSLNNFDRITEFEYV